MDSRVVDLIWKFLDESNRYSSKAVLKSEHQSGLYGGSSGFLLYNRYYYYYTEGKEFIDVQNQIALLSSPFRQSFDSVNFSNGISGVLWTYFHLYRNKLIDIDPQEFRIFQTLLNDELIAQAYDCEWDNLHGAFGILYALLETDYLLENNLNIFLNIVKDKMYDDKKFIFYDAKEEFKVSDILFNLGVSHGLAGHILILIKIQKRFPGNATVAILLSDMVEFLLRAENLGSENGYFNNGEFDLTAPPDRNHRIAWCNGVLGVSFALYRYAFLTGYDSLKKSIFDILVRAAGQRGMNNCNIWDLPLCHGAAGAMHIFNRLYFETGQDQFKIASDYWLNEMLNVYRKTGLKGFGARRLRKGEEFELSPYFLEGLSGISLAMLSKLYPDVEPSWDGGLFLN